MRLRHRLLAVAAGMALLCLWTPLPARSEQAARPDPNPQIEIAYVEPSEAELKPVYEFLLRRKPLETLRQFLAALKLDRKLTVKFDQCTPSGSPAQMYAHYRHDGQATVCYEFVKQIQSLAPRTPVSLVQAQRGSGSPVTPDAAITGPLVEELFHQVAIALFDIWDLPVLGRQDDAADRLTAFIMRNFSSYNIAWNTIVGTAWFLSSTALAAPDLSDVRGVTAQRYYTTLCIAFGGDADPALRAGGSVSFGSFVWSLRRGEEGQAAGDLPERRAAGCPEEYARIHTAFDALIRPHLDLDLMKKVQAVRWVDFND